MSSMPNRLTLDRSLPPKHIFGSLILLACLIFVTGCMLLAKGNDNSVTLVRTVYPSEWNVLHPAGIAYSAQPAQLHLFEKTSIKVSPLLGIDIVTITPQEHFVSTVHLDYVIGNSINVAFADDGQRLFLLSKDAKQLAQVKKDAEGLFDPTTLSEIDISWLGLVKPQGMSVDPGNRYLYILDGAGPRLLRTELLVDSGIDDTQVQMINLARLGIAAARGVAVHPNTGNVFVSNPNEQELYEISPDIKIATRYDLAPLSLADQQGFVFAPSSDLTDPADEIHLFITDSNQPEVSPTPIATEPTSTPIATEPTATPIATAPTSTPVATAPTATPIATSPTATPIATAPDATATAIATSEPATPVPTKTDDLEVPKTGEVLYLPFVSHEAGEGEFRDISAQESPVVPIFGSILEVKLD